MPAVFTMSGPTGGRDPTEDSPPPAAGPAPPPLAVPGTTVPATPSSLPKAPNAFSGARLGAATPPPVRPAWVPPPNVATYPTIPASARNPMIESTALRMEGLPRAGPNGLALDGGAGAGVPVQPGRRTRAPGRPACAAGPESTRPSTTRAVLPVPT